MANIFQLFGQIFIDNSEADKSIDKTTKKAESSGSKIGAVFSSITKGAAAIGTAAVGAAATLGTAAYAMANATAGEADVIDKLSERTSINREELQRWMHAADQSGVSSDVFETAVKKMSSTLDDAAQGSSTALDSLNRLGLTLDDLDGLSTEQKFDKITNALADMEAGTERNALGADLLGKAYTEMLPLLNAGSEGINALKQEADDLGIVMSEEAVKAGVVLGDTIANVKAAANGFKNQLGNAVIPVVQKFANFIIKSLPKVQNLIEKIAPVLADIFEQLLPPLFELIEGVFPVLIGLVETLLPPITDIITAILPVVILLLQTIVPIISKLITGILPPLVSLIKAVVPLVSQIITAILQIAESVLPLVLDLMEAIIPLILQAVEAVLPVLLNLLQSALPLLLQLIETILPVVVQLIEKLLPPILQIVEQIFPVLLDLITILMPLIVQVVEMVLPVVIQLIETLLPPILKIVETVLPLILNLVNAILPHLQTLIVSVLPIIVSLFSVITPILEMLAPLLAPILDILLLILEPLVELLNLILPPLIKYSTNLVNKYMPLLQAAFEKIAEGLQTKFGAAFNTVKTIFENLKTIFSNIIDFVKNVFTGNWESAWENVKNIFAAIWDNLKTIVKAPINYIIDAINTLINGINQISFEIPDWVPGIGNKKLGFDIPSIPKLRRGLDYVPRDNYPALLHKGERVLTESENREWKEEHEESQENPSKEKTVIVKVEVNIEHFENKSSSDIDKLADELMHIIEEKIRDKGDELE